MQFSARVDGQRHIKRIATALALIWTLTGQAHADSFAGKVVGVHDGDTISVLRNGIAERIRLDGIDAPERGQDYGKHAKLFLSELVFGRMVSVDALDTDRYGRTIGRVVVDGRDAGLELVKAGLAWHFTRYSSDPLLARAERDARAARRGLWAQPDPTPPWEFRHPVTRPRSVAALAAPSGPYHGNVRSKVFHAPGCPAYDCPNCRTGLASREAAAAAGYRPHAACVR